MGTEHGDIFSTRPSASWQIIAKHRLSPASTGGKNMLPCLKSLHFFLCFCHNSSSDISYAATLIPASCDSARRSDGFQSNRTGSRLRRPDAVEAPVQDDIKKELLTSPRAGFRRTSHSSATDRKTPCPRKSAANLRPRATSRHRLSCRSFLWTRGSNIRQARRSPRIRLLSILRTLSNSQLEGGCNAVASTFGVLGSCARKVCPQDPVRRQDQPQRVSLISEHVRPDHVR